MGLYRTKPEEVEAVQFLGTDVTDDVFFSNGTSGPLPSWLWKAIATGALGGLAFDAGRLFIAEDTEVMAGEWLVIGRDGVIRVCADGVFKAFYTPARKRLYGDAADVDQTETQEEGNI